tara:strand:- start:131 stop:343 length:213 start_codon:yes stop_codon:yes gene_type:complete
MTNLTIYRNDFNNNKFDKVLLNMNISKEMLNTFDVSIYDDLLNEKFENIVLPTILKIKNIKETNIYFELI